MCSGPALPAFLHGGQYQAIRGRQIHARLDPQERGYPRDHGTADKVVNGRYSKTKVLTDFMAIMPADHPRYLLLIMLDEPKATPETHGFTTSGWNAVPTGAKVVARIAPLLGIEPRMDLPPADQLILASLKESR